MSLSSAAAGSENSGRRQARSRRDLRIGRHLARREHSPPSGKSGIAIRCQRLRFATMKKSVVASALLALFFWSALGVQAADKKPTPAAGPGLRSAHALIVDANSGEVIYE